MAVPPRLNLTRDQFASFLQDFEQIKQLKDCSQQSIRFPLPLLTMLALQQKMPQPPLMTHLPRLHALLMH